MYNVTPRVTLLVLIPPTIFALFRYSPGDPYVRPLLTDASRDREKWRGREEDALVNPFIYLFMCHGGAWIDEGVRDAAYSRRMHRTGNPTRAPVQDEGMAKVTGIRTRILDSPEARFSSFLIYRVFIYLRVYTISSNKISLSLDFR